MSNFFFQDISNFVIWRSLTKSAKPNSDLRKRLLNSDVIGLRPAPQLKSLMKQEMSQSERWFALLSSSTSGLFDYKVINNSMKPCMTLASPALALQSFSSSRTLV